MKTPQELYGMCVTIYNEACDGIAELMRNHNCDELKLKKYEYEYDLQLPALQLYTYDTYILDGEDEGYATGRPVNLRLVPDHIEIEVDHWNEGGYMDYINETDLNALEALQLYRVVDEIFGFIDNGTPAYHETLENEE